MSTLGIVCFVSIALLFVYMVYIVIAGLAGHLSRMQTESRAFVEKLYPERVHQARAMAHTSRRYERHPLGV
jgi:hypothetical protein